MRFFSTIFISCVFVSTAAPLQAAEWRECEKAKLQQLRLTERARTSAPTKTRSKHRPSANSTRATADDIDTWLWKNCREYSYELRTLEQQRM
jgi:hypothetical protein